MSPYPNRQMNPLMNSISKQSNFMDFPQGGQQMFNDQVSPFGGPRNSLNPLSQSIQFSQHNTSIGPQYELLLKEKQEMMKSVTGTQKQLEAIKKEVNEVKKKNQKMKLELKS